MFSVFFPQLYLHNLITVLAVCVTQAQSELFHDSYCISVHLLLFVLSELSIVLSVSYIELHDIAYIVYFLCSDSEPVERHSDFRLFCCMNPSTDVGKKSLPDSIKNR